MSTKNYLTQDQLNTLANRIEQVFVKNQITGANGKSLIFNESDGGGAKFEHSDGTWSFAGVNDGGENGLAGQLYVVKKDASTGKYVGSRLNMTKDGFYYTNGKNSYAFTADDEIATKGDFNDYYTAVQTDDAIASAIAGVTQFDYQIVSQLPQEGVKGIIYLVPNTGSGANVYDEYIWIVSGDPAVGHFELFGTKELELVEYKGSATVTIADGTGADAGKKIVSVKYNSTYLAEDQFGLTLSSSIIASLQKADTAVQPEDIGEISAETINALWS